MAPVLPYLAEEIHSTLHEGDEAVSQLSVFAKKWTPVVRIDAAVACAFTDILLN
jgi:isoleucyl-tRNA synthetase